MNTRAKIIAKRVGFGNQIQFIPVIRRLLRHKTELCSDTETYQELGIDCRFSDDRVKENYVVYEHNVIKFMKAFAENPSGAYYGFKYSIKGRHVGLGYYKSIVFDRNKHEIFNNLSLIGTADEPFEYSVERVSNAVRGTVVIGISRKREKQISRLSEVIDALKKDRHEVLLLGDRIDHEDYVPTPTIRELRETISRAEYFIGSDGGLMHLADAMGIPSLVLFGPTSVIKNRPINNRRTICLQTTFSCAPCYDWNYDYKTKQIRCPEFPCMNFPVEVIIDEFRKITRS